MNRRDFLLSTSVAITCGFTSIGSATQSEQNRVNGISPPKFEEGWDYERVSGDAPNFNWEGIRAEQIELREVADEYASSAPAIASFLAIRATPTQILREESEDTSSRVTIGGGPVPFSYAVNNPMTIFREKTCGLNPHSDSTTEFAEEIFTEQTRELHRYDGEPSIQDGMQKEWSMGCVFEFGYEKSEYDDFGFTFDSKWEAGDDDELEDINFRGLLSIERSDDEFLFVGGMVPDEGVSTGTLGLGEDIVEDESNLQSSLLSMMEDTKLA